MTAQGVKNERADISAEKFILSFSDLDLTQSNRTASNSLQFRYFRQSDRRCWACTHGVDLSGELRSPSVAFDISVEKAKFDAILRLLLMDFQRPLHIIYRAINSAPRRVFLPHE